MSVLSIGTFDGLHLGHQQIIGKVLQQSSLRGQISVIISFKEHPFTVLNGGKKRHQLCPSSYKKRKLKEMGIDEVELLTFDERLREVSASDFLKRYLAEKWRPSVIVVGYDSHFGKNREGNREFLQKYAGYYGYELIYVPPLMYLDEPISSSNIRQLLLKGKPKEAAKLLGREYCLIGKVGQGLGKGKDFGFPTANLVLEEPNQLIPKEGLYLSRVLVDGISHFALTNIGSSPTVKDTGIVEIESHLIDFTANLYGKEMQVNLLSYLREEKMFANVAELIKAMQKDLAMAKAMIEEYKR